MVELQLLDHGGQSVPLEAFPFRLGRGDASHIPFSDTGVWDNHLEIDFDLSSGFSVRNLPPAITRVNGHSVERAVLKTGDVIELGSARVRFWLSAPRRRSWRLREAMTWLGLLGIVAAQIAIIRALAG